MKTRRLFAAAVLSCLAITSACPISSYAEAGTELSMEDICTVTRDGSSQSNLMTPYSSTLNSHGVINGYLQANTDGSYSRICPKEERLYVETFNEEFDLESRIEIEMELPLWGGFFSGEEYNFCLFGQENAAESDSVEVIRVVKYSKDWERLGSTSLYGCNTSCPLYAGTPRMYEKDGMLYIQTSHKMYKSESDGLNHQANFQIHINSDTMECVYELSDVSWILEGYVSHSFDQYVRADESYVYTADLGDAYPRSVVVCKKTPDGEVQNYYETYPVYGSVGNNYTGVTLGGFELSEEDCIIVGNSVVQNETYFNTDVRNIFLSFTSKDMSSSETVWLTDFDTEYRVSSPKLLKIDDNTFIAMWNEFDEHESTDWYYLSNTTDAKCRIVKFNAEGEILESISNDALVTECDPVIAGDEIVWYKTDGSGSTAFYHMEYDNLTQYDGLQYGLIGDADMDGAVDSSDASAVLAEYALLATGGAGTFTAKQNELADVNSDGAVDSSDASSILAYYAYIATGGNGSFADYFYTNGESE